MSASSTRFIRRCAQWIPKEESRHIPHATRGIYALLHRHPGKDKYDVVYIGMTARSSIGRRLARHKKPKAWSHFSIFEVKRSVGENELKELEGLLREIYRKDTQANRFNKQKKFRKLQDVREDKLVKWGGRN
jgi:hypothetical protein